MANLKERAILHVVVVGFHHKKGCQVEYAYPSLIDEDEDSTSNVPDIWKHLPSLALPDGAHNYTSDTVYFHLPSKKDPLSTVYGVSCYRQMDASKLLKKDSEVTRNTIQKSVCVLSTLPLYGLIQAKLELITHVYFKECDFSQVRILEDAYTQLNAQLTHSMLGTSQVFLGLSCRSVVQKYKSKILILIKLIMLERRVLFYGGPAKDICSTLLSVLSLFPELVEHGLKESAAYAPNKLVSPTLKNLRLNSTTEDFLEVQYSSNFLEQCQARAPEIAPVIGESTAEEHSEQSESRKSSNTVEIPDLLANVTKENSPDHEETKEEKKDSPDEDTANMEELLDADDGCVFHDDRLSLQITTSSVDSSPCHNDVKQPPSEEIMQDRTDPAKLSRSDSKQSNASQGSISSVASDLSQASVKAMTGIKSRISHMWPGKDEDGPKIEMANMRSPSPTTLVSDALGFPLPLFTKGVLCHPYLSLQYYDLLRDANVRGFVIGASNMLFKQKRSLLDVIVESTEDGDVRLDIADGELRKQLNLSTADLRFTETLVRTVTENSGDEFMDETEWEGGDEWLREQFRLYLVSLLATVNKNDEEHMADFNLSFIQAWQTTLNYKTWKSVEHPGLDTFDAGHPCHGQLGIDDVRLKVAHSLNSTERGKKVAAAAAQTGKAVLSTGKAVGGALSTAKSAMSSSVTSWFGRIRHWTATEEDEEPYMPSTQSDNVTNNSLQNEADSKSGTNQSGGSSAKEADSKPATDQSGGSSAKGAESNSGVNQSDVRLQKEVELKSETDFVARLDAGDAEGLTEVAEVIADEVKVHEPVAHDTETDQLDVIAKVLDADEEEELVEVTEVNKVKVHETAAHDSHTES